MKELKIKENKIVFSSPFLDGEKEMVLFTIIPSWLKCRWSEVGKGVVGGRISSITADKLYEILKEYE